MLGLQVFFQFFLLASDLYLHQVKIFYLFLKIMLDTLKHLYNMGRQSY
jgi:hypothetical protein